MIEEIRFKIFYELAFTVASLSSRFLEAHASKIDNLDQKGERLMFENCLRFSVARSKKRNETSERESERLTGSCCPRKSWLSPRAMLCTFVYGLSRKKAGQRGRTLVFVKVFYFVLVWCEKKKEKERDHSSPSSERDSLSPMFSAEKLFVTVLFVGTATLSTASFFFLAEEDETEVVCHCIR